LNLNPLSYSNIKIHYTCTIRQISKKSRSF